MRIGELLLIALALELIPAPGQPAETNVLRLRFYARSPLPITARARARRTKLVEYRYREAKPRFDVVKAKAAFDRGQTVCHFFDERDNLVGEAFVLYWSEAGLGLEHSGDCFEQSALRAGWAGRTDLYTVVAARKNNSGKARVYVECPSCRKPFGILIYKGRWACGDCHKLGYRSQFVPPDVFASAKLFALQEKIGRGRPRRMRQANFRKAQKELETLKKSAGPFPSEVSVAHQRVIRATWMTPAEAEWLAHPDYEMTDGQFTPRPGSEAYAMDAPPGPPPNKPSGSSTAKPTVLMVSPWLDDEEGY